MVTGAKATVATNQTKRISPKLARISRMLTAANIANLSESADQPDLEDDEIIITPEVHVQVGTGYLAVVRELPDGRFEYTDTTERMLVAKILEAQQAAKDEATTH